jgi:ubiquitin-conjugating enzyme E2 O
VLVREPYYCEPGFERQMGTEEGRANCVAYSEAAFLIALRAMRVVVARPPDHFHKVVQEHFMEALPKVSKRCEALVGASAEQPLAEGDIFAPTPSQGFQRMLKKQMPHIEDLLADLSLIEKISLGEDPDSGEEV